MRRLFADQRRPAFTVWIADGSNFPRQSNLNAAFDHYVESLSAIYGKPPADCLVFLEHKLYEPAFYSTAIADWGSSLMAACDLGPKAECLVDLGHHAPPTNIEQIVARLIRAQTLVGFHVFNGPVDAEMREAPGFSPAYMIDQSHNVADPIGVYRASGYRTAKAAERAVTAVTAAGIV